MPHQAETQGDVGRQSGIPPNPGESENASWSRRSSAVLPKDEGELVTQKGGGRAMYSEEIHGLESEGCHHEWSGLTLGQGPHGVWCGGVATGQLAGRR